MVNIYDLPDEILHSIFRYVPALSAPALEQTSTRFANAANGPLLWKFYCQHDFTFWDEKHRIKEKFACPASEFDWKDIYKTRHAIDVTTTKRLNSILASQTGRIQKVNEIISFGYDAKDTLLRHAAAHSSLEDHLARRYYSTAILGCLHRAMAIPEWSKLKAAQDVPLERALGVFDMFVLKTGPGDFDDISARLSEIVGDIASQYPDIDQLTPRAKAVALAEHLRASKLTGIEDGTEFHRIDHNFLGIALLSDDHNSLPIISAAIYCYIAQKFGLNANPCGFPFHVHVIVRPESGYDLDGNRLEDGCEGALMYMDPWRSAEETPLSDLQSQLHFLGALTQSHSTYLRESLTPEIILRCAMNILNSVLQMPRHFDTSNAKYAALWASTLLAEYAGADALPQPGTAAAAQQHPPLSRFLPSLIEHFATEFPLDVYLIEKYIIPLFGTLPAYNYVLETIHVMKASDEIPKQVRRRTLEHRNVRYYVGQVFRHRRYDYMAVVIGWDTECGAEERWIERMGVDQLHAGRYQSFYSVLVEDKSVRYVAEENIDVINVEFNQISPALGNLAGKFFKRWDQTTRRFVSNVRDEYPDD